jgi:hypothetical protein
MHDLRHMLPWRMVLAQLHTAVHILLLMAELSGLPGMWQLLLHAVVVHILLAVPAAAADVTRTLVLNTASQPHYRPASYNRKSTVLHFQKALQPHVAGRMV